MAATRLTVTIDVSLIVQTVRRLKSLPYSPVLERHLDALDRERGLVELQAPAPGTDCTWRAVPSVQLLRVLESYGRG